jgi:large subunit ribosomal protein L21
MFAIIKTGGKQYRVAKDSVLRIEKLDGEPGSTVEFNEVLMIGDSAKPSVIGMPLVKGVTVRAEIVGQVRDPKIIVFKKKRRQNYRRKKGHKQELTQIKIVEIKKQ